MDDQTKIKELELEIEQLKKEFRTYVDKKQQEETQRMKTALLTAGGVIIAMGTFIWAEIIWPVISSGRMK